MIEAKHAEGMVRSRNLWALLSLNSKEKFHSDLSSHYRTFVKMYNRFCNCGKTKNPLVEQNDDTDMLLVPAVSLEIQIVPLSVFFLR